MRRKPGFIHEYMIKKTTNLETLEYLIHMKRQIRIFFILLLNLIANHLFASYPIVRNFTRSFYDAGTQNWAIAQDELGRMYFANNNGLLCFDGSRWSLSHLSNYTTVRSLHVDSRTGRIYAGGSEEFGYFFHDEETGKLSYHSLTETVEKPYRQFHEIWNIHRQNNTFWFQSDFNIFRFDGKQTQAIISDNKITTSALINGNMYIGTIENGISVVHDMKLSPIPQNEMLKDKRICAILPYQHISGTLQTDILVVTAFDGIFRYDGEHVTPFITEIDAFLKDNQIFCAATCGGEVVFGTVDNGIVIADMSNGSNTYINRNTGLQNDTVLSIFYDKQANLWLGLDNGIDCVIQNSPIRSLLGNNLYGTGYASLLHNNVLFLGTNQGLYATQYPIPSVVHPTRIPPVLKGQVWNIDTIGNTVFVGNDAGLYEKVDNSFRRLPKIPGTWAVSPLRNHPDYALASTYENFFLIKKENGHWHFVRKISGYGESGGHVLEDEHGYLWIADWMKGLFRLKLSEDLTHFSEALIYNKNKGLPLDYNNALCRIGGKMLVSTLKGYYNYDAALDSMIPNKDFNESFGTDRNSSLYESQDHNIWSVSHQHIWVARRSSDDKFTIDSVTYKPMADKLIAGFNNFNIISPNHLIISGLDGFYEVNVQHKDTVKWKSQVFVSRIYATGGMDSLIYTANNSIKDIALELPYTLNSLRFEFVMPEYRSNHAPEYSCYLEHYDNGWNGQGHAHSKEYTQLREGEYKFHVRAFNTYNGATSEYVLSLKIAPPWYRSIYAKTGYGILLFVSILLLIRYIQFVSLRSAKEFARRKEKEMAELKRHAEEEALRKDFEITQLKSKQLEHDIKYKSQELSNITMNVIRKNEILIDIADQINKLKEDKAYTLSPSAAKQLGNIHQHIQENISHDDDWQNFSHNFDVVYDDFLKRLAENYPKLTNNDLRICAYLKMGLSSKDIAPLLNISYRSVEMSRYRLRAKLGLERDVNLTQFLQHF